MSKVQPVGGQSPIFEIQQTQLRYQTLVRVAQNLGINPAGYPDVNSLSDAIRQARLAVSGQGNGSGAK